MKETNELYREKDAQYHFNVYKRYPVTLQRGEGHRVWDIDNLEYIDAFSGISVLNIGHCHPKLVEAVRYQAGTLMHVSNFFTTEQMAILSETLCNLSGMEKVFFCNTGAESLEGAIKLARKHYWDKNKKYGTILTMTNCFHGRTLAATAAGKNKFHEGFGPVPPGFNQVTYNDEASLENAFKRHDVVAVLMELVQGEGGIHVATPEFVAKARQLCRDHGALLITDQVQDGLGRAGKWFTNEHYGFLPDIITNAKALGGGIPIAAIQTTAKIASSLEAGLHGTTFGGNPFASTAALATLKIMKEENLPERSEQKGEEMIRRLREGAGSVKGIKEVRGRAMIIGIELKFNGMPVVEGMRRKGILIHTVGERIIRLLPPLNTPDDALREITDKLLETIEETSKKPAK